MQKSVKGLLGGGLRPNDPRRFLIEAMVGAMNADGVADPRELQAVEHRVASHPLFQGLGAAAARTLIELSTDAIKFAGSSLDRAPAIARGLPARIHRLAAFGMAAEIAAVDEQLVEAERRFLDALRVALRVRPLEAEALVSNARAGHLTEYLEDRYRRIKTLIPLACEVFALRALGRGMANDEERFRIRDFFAAIPDLALSPDELDAELYQAFRRPRAADAQVFGELSRVGESLPDLADRYWLVVYSLVAEQPATVPTWRVIPFIGVMQTAFRIIDSDMESAAADALTFPPAMPRPS